MTTAAPKQSADTGVEAAWEGFSGSLWQRELNVRAFIQLNYTPYEGDETFLATATARTKKISDTLTKLFVEERKKGVLDISQVPSSITAHAPGQGGIAPARHGRTPRSLAEHTRPLTIVRHSLVMGSALDGRQSKTRTPASGPPSPPIPPGES